MRSIQPAQGAETAPAPRLAGLDAFRGLTLLSMAAYHGVWDLVCLFGRDWSWYTGPLGRLWQQSICWSFLLLSGFCWPLGRRPCRRGILLLLAGGLVTLATFFLPEGRIVYGVLTLLGSCALLLIPLHKLFDRIPALWGVIVSFLLFLLCREVPQGNLAGLPLPALLYRNGLTAYLGFPGPDFFSADYFPLLPWSFLFCTGYFLHGILGRAAWLRRLPGPRFLCALGRRSLLFYLLHQPILYLILSLLPRP